MPNPNYLRGRRFEYQIKKRWTNDTFRAIRTAGSHGEFDIIAYYPYEMAGDYPRHAPFLKKGSTREISRGFEYLTYVTPLVGYGIQCKVRKLKRKSTKRKTKPFKFDVTQYS